jgi:hypothetical protein
MQMFVEVDKFVCRSTAVTACMLCTHAAAGSTLPCPAFGLYLLLPMVLSSDCVDAL